MKEAERISVPVSSGALTIPRRFVKKEHVINLESGTGSLVIETIELDVHSVAC